MAQSLFILPPRSCVAVADPSYTYALYNYYGRGPIAAMKRARFDRALRLAAPGFGGTVIDMGCADGTLLPSLTRHFKRVIAVDHSPEHLERARYLIRAAGLSNVEVICNDGLSAQEMRQRIGPGCNTMLCLETLEHVGSQPDMWGTKARFVADCLSMLEPDGRMIVSVPKMVGPIMMVKYLLQRSLGLTYDHMTFRQLLRATFLYDATSLEPQWNNLLHIGFNHRKLEKAVVPYADMIHRSQSLISMFYILKRKCDLRT